MSLELENGSRIVSLPSKEGTIRGYSAVNLIVIDESQEVPDASLTSVLPMLLVSGGRILALGTPQGRRGWWYEKWDRDPTWEHVKVTVHECAHIPADRIEELRSGMPERNFGQECLGEFAETEGSAFNEEMIRRAFSSDVEALKVAT